VLIVRALNGLDDAISVSVVKPLMLDHGWEIDPNDPGPIDGARYLHEVYTRADASYSGRVTVPTLWDTRTETIVNNESSELIRMLDTGWEGIGRSSDLYPEDLRDEIDAINERVYETVNDGVYRTGFATKQTAYDDAVGKLFDTLDFLEDRLTTRPYVCGDRATEPDWRLFPTLARFDPVYVVHFKCNKRRLIDYPNLYAYAQRLYAVPGVSDTCDIEQTKLHYYGSHPSINPLAIVPKGPAQWLG
jgi:putative glutathione S-transferase